MKILYASFFYILETTLMPTCWKALGERPPPIDVLVCKACDKLTTVAAGMLPGLMGAAMLAEKES